MRHTSAHVPHIGWDQKVLIGVSALAGIGFALSLYAFYVLHERTTTLSQELASTTALLIESRNVFATDLAALRGDTAGLSQALSHTKSEVIDSISAVRNQVGGVQETVGSITGTVTTLKKLSTIDPELLSKYSRVFFLNENYRPAHLVAIPQDHVYSNSKQELFSAGAFPFLQNMLSAAKADGVELYVKSAFRSFDEQQMVKAQHVITYGAGTANSFSADQGYSEHQLGTTVDFVTTGLSGELTESFDRTKAFQWLQANAHRFGFTLSYPKGNAYYTYEPWHWRFIGLKLASYLQTSNKKFYDLDQREIDTYLAELFD